MMIYIYIMIECLYPICLSVTEVIIFPSLGKLAKVGISGYKYIIFSRKTN